jgi:hypothetical protein
VTDINDLLGATVTSDPVETTILTAPVVPESPPATFAEGVKTPPIESIDKILDALMGRMQAPEQAIHSGYRKLCIYGPPGTGKTILACTAPRVLHYAVEPNGPLSLKNHPDVMKNVVNIMEFRSLEQLEMLLDKIETSPEAFTWMETLVIDSFSELQKEDLDGILLRESKNDASRNKYIPTGPDYNQNTERMRMILRKLEKMKKNVVLLCHDKEEKDDATGIIKSRPNLTPKLAGSLSGKMDIIGYLSLSGSGETAKRALQVHPTRAITAKTRVGPLAASIENPTWDALFSNTSTT